ncbi:MerR family transcriptional regulator [Amycolatopsis saalfeldensis]|uniref:DNA-binding transcriptional regulator, MerR family n=1 Tax=Amycolatopsis saalfeldensis TaxID=394193 RepID=A0A1H8Y5Q0_9PSEU|nr:MerR family transcriptional regulator [Amycolatopsis saalfeldensis]SEP47313.1 DNA-binding transcriptional regulator, MerR family [Amycolatopsis saalfeldensis]
MFAIGEFARHGRVSVRMLRHYDAIGLLRPAHVDPATGYRSYQAAQLTELNRIVALKDLGFTLEQVRAMLAEQVGVEQVRDLLALRRADLEAAVAATAQRLAQVEARLQAIELDGRLPDHEVVVKHLPAVRLAELSTSAGSFHPDDIGPVVHPLCAELGRRLATAEVTPVGRLTCYYVEDGGGAVTVHAAVPVATEHGPARNGLSIIDLPAGDHATLVHRGPMDAVLPAWQALAHWADAHGRHSTGPARELYLDCPADPAHWVTELQEPLADLRAV